MKTYILALMSVQILIAFDLGYQYLCHNNMWLNAIFFIINSISFFTNLKHIQK